MSDLPLLPGVTRAYRKDGGCYYRAAITCRGRHISLGSYRSEEEAGKAYETSLFIVREGKYVLSDYEKDLGLDFAKWVTLLNFRDSGIYIRNPIYLKKDYFQYYMNKELYFLFDRDDLFYYSNHKIMMRGGHLFVSDYGMQVNLFSRYGIKNYAVPDRDYRFINGDERDLRYSNIEVINRYHGVSYSIWKGNPCYTARIHIVGDYLIGRYLTEQEAAAAYNKAADTIKSSGFQKNFPVNFINDLDEIEYVKLYHSLRISRNIRKYASNYSDVSENS